MTDLEPNATWTVHRSIRDNVDLRGGHPTTRSRRGPLFDHFVGAQQNRLRHGEPERLGGLGVNSHLKFDRHLNRQVGRLCATENAIHIGRGAPKRSAPSGP